MQQTHNLHPGSPALVIGQRQAGEEQRNVPVDFLAQTGRQFSQQRGFVELQQMGIAAADLLHRVEGRLAVAGQCDNFGHPPNRAQVAAAEEIDQPGGISRRSAHGFSYTFRVNPYSCSSRFSP